MTVLAVPCSPISSTAWKKNSSDQIPKEFDVSGKKYCLIKVLLNYLVLLGDRVNEEVGSDVVHVWYQDTGEVRDRVRRVDVLVHSTGPVLPVACNEFMPQCYSGERSLGPLNYGNTQPTFL